MNTSDLKQTAIINSLRQTRLFSDLSSEDLESVAQITVPKPLEREEYLFYEGDPPRGFYVVQKGAINVHRMNAQGKEQVIHVFRSGETMAEATLATEEGYPANARAIENSQVLLIGRNGFLSLIRNNPELAIKMLASMSLHLRTLVEQLEDLSLKDVETRLVNWLLRQCPDPHSANPHSFVLTTTKRVLAAELGTVSETFSRTLAKLRDQGLLEVQGKTLVIHSPKKLRSLLEQNMGGFLPD